MSTRLSVTPGTRISDIYRLRRTTEAARNLSTTAIMTYDQISINLSQDAMSQSYVATRLFSRPMPEKRRLSIPNACQSSLLKHTARNPAAVPKATLVRLDHTKHNQQNRE